MFWTSGIRERNYPVLREYSVFHLGFRNFLNVSKISGYGSFPSAVSGRKQECVHNLRIRNRCFDRYSRTFVSNLCELRFGDSVRDIFLEFCLQKIVEPNTFEVEPKSHNSDPLGFREISTCRTSRDE